MISPKKHLQKEYIATLRDSLTTEQREKIETGIVLSDGTACRPATVSGLDDKRASIVLTEGKYHQVRRMFAAVGNFVEDLCRVRIGSFILDGIAEGQTVLISPDEVAKAE